MIQNIPQASICPCSSISLAKFSLSYNTFITETNVTNSSSVWCVMIERDGVHSNQPLVQRLFAPFIQRISQSCCSLTQHKPGITSVQSADGGSPYHLHRRQCGLWDMCSV